GQQAEVDLEARLPGRTGHAAALVTVGRRGLYQRMKARKDIAPHRGCSPPTLLRTPPGITSRPAPSELAAVPADTPLDHLGRHPGYHAVALVEGAADQRAGCHHGFRLQPHPLADLDIATDPYAVGNPYAGRGVKPLSRLGIKDRML